MSLTPAERAICAKIAAEITEHPERWTQGFYARNASAQPLDARNPNAVCWCTLGFIDRELPGNPGCPIEIALTEFTQTSSVAEWNDTPGRTASEVAAIFAKLAQVPQS